MPADGFELYLPEHMTRQPHEARARAAPLPAPPCRGVLERLRLDRLIRARDLPPSRLRSRGEMTRFVPALDRARARGGLRGRRACRRAPSRGHRPQPGRRRRPRSHGAALRHAAGRPGHRRRRGLAGRRAGAPLARSLDGRFTIPAVAYDGSPGGLSADGRTLVLINPRTGFPRRITTLAVLDTQRLRARDVIRLTGDFSFDAISPDGRLLYLVQYLSQRDPTRYLVRLYDLEAGRLLPEPIIDPREVGDVMRGTPITRAASPDGRWAYTLYDGAGEHPFIHALDTVGRNRTLHRPARADGIRPALRAPPRAVAGRRHPLRGAPGLRAAARRRRHYRPGRSASRRPPASRARRPRPRRRRTTTARRSPCSRAPWCSRSLSWSRSSAC